MIYKVLEFGIGIHAWDVTIARYHQSEFIKVRGRGTVILEGPILMNEGLI